MVSRFGGLPRELYFPKGLYFPEVHSTEGNIVPRENITILAPPTLPRSLVTRLGVCVQNKTEHKLDSLRAFYC